MSYTTQPDKREAYPDGRDIIRGRLNVLFASLNTIDWAVPVPEVPASKEHVEASVPYTPPEVIEDRPATLEAVQNSVPFVTEQPVVGVVNNNDDEDRLAKARALVDEYAFSQKGPGNVPEIDK